MSGMLRNKLELDIFWVGPFIITGLPLLPDSGLSYVLLPQMFLWLSLLPPVKNAHLLGWKGIAIHIKYSSLDISLSLHSFSGSRSTCCRVFFMVGLIQTAQAYTSKRPEIKPPCWAKCNCQSLVQVCITQVTKKEAGNRTGEHMSYTWGISLVLRQGLLK